MWQHEPDKVPNAYYNVYLGNKNYEDDFRNDNTLCFTGGKEGLANCAGSGRYLIWELIKPLPSKVEVSDILVYNYAD